MAKLTKEQKKQILEKVGFEEFLTYDKNTHGYIKAIAFLAYIEQLLTEVEQKAVMECIRVVNQIVLDPVDGQILPLWTEDITKLLQKLAEVGDKLSEKENEL